MDQIRHLQTSPMMATSGSNIHKVLREDKTDAGPSDKIDLNSSDTSAPKVERPVLQQTEKTEEAAEQKPALPKPPTPEKELTILFYINGEYKDIGEASANSMLSLERVGSTKDINVVAQLGRTAYEPDPKDAEMNEVHVPIDNDWAGVRRYEIRQDAHEGMNVGTFKDYLDLEDKMPANPLLKYIIGKQYWVRGQKDVARKYWDEAKKLGAVEFMNDPKSDKSKEIRKEFNLHTKWMDEAVIGKKNFASEMVKDLGTDVHMKDPGALQDFVQWGMEKYPAKHYMIVVMAHGAAWMGASEMNPRQIGDAITKGVAAANEASGKNEKIDLLTFNSCYMGNAEAAVEMRKASDVALISENYATTGAFGDWPIFIDYLQRVMDKGAEFDPKGFASEMVEYYRAEGKEVRDNYPEFTPYNQSYLTLSAVDNKKVGGVLDAWQYFTDTLKENRVSDKDLFTAVKEGKNYPSGAYNPKQVFGFYEQIRDIGSIMDNIIQSELPDAVKEAAGQVKDAVAECVINEQHMGKDMDGSQGLTIWGPTNFVDYDLMAKDYPAMAPTFSQNSGWMDRLDKASANVPADIRQGFHDALATIKEIKKEIAAEGITDEKKKELEAKLEAERDKAIEFKHKSDFTIDREPASLFKSAQEDIRVSAEGMEEAAEMKEQAVKDDGMTRR